MRNFKYLLIILFTFGCTSVSELKDKNISQLLSKEFNIASKDYDLIILKNQDCLSCEKTTFSYVMRLKEQKKIVYIITQEIREIEKKNFYEDKPYIKAFEHVFNNELGKRICDFVDLELKSTILVQVRDDTISYSTILRERYSEEDLKDLKNN